MPTAATVADIALPAVAPRVRAGRHLALARACGIPRRPVPRRGDPSLPRLRVHDALAGWGTDGLVLAGLGCAVHMSERHPAIYRRLRKRLREHGDDGLGPVSAALEDARERWRHGPAFDVVYLDPMFGPHQKTAAASRPMQVLAALAPPLEDIGALIALARAAARDRVVLKRRRSGKAYGAPAWHVAAKTVRFDVYRPSVAP